MKHTQRAFLLFECILVIVLIGILALFSRQALLSQTQRAANLLIQSIQYTKILALTQNTRYTNEAQTKWLTHQFPSINPSALISTPTFWQLQFHQSGTYTKSSFSIYLDTPRISSTTHYDGRPMAGDIIAIEGINLRCLSGYNNTNISDFCKNNADTGVRFLESFGVTLDIKIQNTCRENQTARISFDSSGFAYCGANIKLQEPLVITLTSSFSNQYVCVLPPYGLIAQGKICKKYL